MRVKLQKYPNITKMIKNISESTLKSFGEKRLPFWEVFGYN